MALRIPSDLGYLVADQANMVLTGSRRLPLPGKAVPPNQTRS